MRRIFYFVVFILAVSSCGNGKSTMGGKDDDFKVKDTANIDKIFLANRSNDQITLTKESGKWMVNGEFEARGDMIGNLLYVIRNVEVKQFVPKTSIDTELKRLAVAATKVEIYIKGKLSKVYYVGGPTQDHFGTYMVMQDSETPYVCYLPGHRGYISLFYTPLLDEWRSHQIFNYPVTEIATVRTDFYRNPEQSWEITNIDNKSFKVKSIAANKFMDNFDTSAVKMVLKEFKALGFESFITVDQKRMDSVKVKYPLYKITLTTREGGKRTLDLYEIPLQPGTYTMDGKEAKVDVDKMYGIVDGSLVTLCQYFTYDPVTIPLVYLMGQKPDDFGYPGR